LSAAGSVLGNRPDKLRVCVRRHDHPATGGVRDVTVELFLDRRQRDRATLRSATETLTGTATASDAATTADFGAFDDVTMRRSSLHRQRGGKSFDSLERVSKKQNLLQITVGPVGCW